MNGKFAWKQSHLLGFRSASVDLRSLFLHFVCLERICDVTELQPSKTTLSVHEALEGQHSCHLSIMVMVLPSVLHKREPFGLDDAGFRVIVIF